MYVNVHTHIVARTCENMQIFKYRCINMCICIGSRGLYTYIYLQVEKYTCFLNMCTFVCGVYLCVPGCVRVDTIKLMHVYFFFRPVSPAVAIRLLSDRTRTALGRTVGTKNRYPKNACLSASRQLQICTTMPHCFQRLLIISLLFLSFLCLSATAGPRRGRRRSADRKRRCGCGGAAYQAPSLQSLPRRTL